MSGIVCAIRGGPHSQPTIDEAISLARETDLPLYFLYIVNLDFLAHTTSARTHTINLGMEQMGEFILLAAQSRVADQEPVVAFLTATIPGANNKVLFYCLSVGSAMGGNGSLIGASANMVTAGIADRAGFSISYAYFLKKGFPVLLITVGLATLWLLFCFLVLPN
jgi:Na+/H+ antiporter NhaD/arsenite permease-like protein